MLLTTTATTSTPKPASSGKIIFWWHYTYGCGMFIMAILTAFASILTLLALRKRYGLQKTLGSTIILLRALSVVEVLNGLVGVPLMAANKMFGEKMADYFNSTTIYWLCTLIIETTPALHKITAWYLFCIAASRLALVVWPQRAKRWLGWPVVQCLLCGVPIILGLLSQVTGRITHATTVVFVEGRCVPQPYAPRTPEGLKMFANNQLMSTLLAVGLPYPLSFVLYVFIFLFLLFQRRRHGMGVQKVQEVNATTSLPTVSSKPSQSSQKSQVQKANNSKASEDRRFHVITVMASVFIVQMACTIPLHAMYWSGFYYTEAFRTSGGIIAGDVAAIFYYASFPLNNVMYAVTSKDFRKVYKQFFTKK